MCCKNIFACCACVRSIIRFFFLFVSVVSADGQLNPEALVKACEEKGQPSELRMQVRGTTVMVPVTCGAAVLVAVRTTVFVQNARAKPALGLSVSLDQGCLGLGLEWGLGRTDAFSCRVKKQHAKARKKQQKLIPGTW